MTVSEARTRSWAARIAPPVPSGSGWTTVSVSSGRPGVRSRSGETITATRSAPASRAASTGQATIGRPQTGCSTLGMLERMRVPSPAAMTRTVSPLTWGIVDAPGRYIRCGAVPRPTSVPALTPPARGGKGGHELSGHRSSSPFRWGVGSVSPGAVRREERIEMTSQKSFKRRVRARMEKTGESYMAARRRLIETGEHPPAAVVEPRVSDEAVERATGHTWSQWFGILDRWGAAERAHPEIARWLAAEHDVD